MAREKKADSVEIPDIKRRRPEVPVRCGQCLFLSRYKTYDEPCDQLGTVPSSVPCARFTPDPRALSRAGITQRALAALSASGSVALAATVLMAARRCQRLGHEIGSIVYFRVLGDDYMNNYASGVVTGCTRDDQIVVAGAHDFTAVLVVSNVLNTHDWNRCRDTLVRRGRINDPAGGLRRISTRGTSQLATFEPPRASGAAPRRSTGRRSAFNGKRKVTLSGGDAR